MGMLDKFIAGAAGAGAEGLLMQWKAEIMAERDARLNEYRRSENKDNQAFQASENVADREFRAGESQADREQREALQDKSQTHAEKMQSSQHEFLGGQTDKTIQADNTRASLDRQSRSGLIAAQVRGLDADTRVTQRLLETGENLKATPSYFQPDIPDENSPTGSVPAPYMMDRRDPTKRVPLDAGADQAPAGITWEQFAGNAKRKAGIDILKDAKAKALFEAGDKAGFEAYINALMNKKPGTVSGNTD